MITKDSSQITEDPIVAETRAARQRLVDRFGGDLDALWQHIQQVQKQFGDRVVRRPAKPPVVITRKIS